MRARGRKACQDSSEPSFCCDPRARLGTEAHCVLLAKWSLSIYIPNAPFDFISSLWPSLFDLAAPITCSATLQVADQNGARECRASPLSCQAIAHSVSSCHTFTDQRESNSSCWGHSNASSGSCLSSTHSSKET